MRIIPIFLSLLAAAWAQTPPPVPGSDLQAVVVTDLGTFRFEFAPDKAPEHVERFIAHAKEGYYDGSAFHRVGKELIQGGDPGLKDPNTPRELWGKGDRSVRMPDELNDMTHARGVVSTIRQYTPNSDGLQFFVVLTSLPALDLAYTPFGRVIDGMDVVDKISQVPVDQYQQTVTPVRILKITIEKKPASSISSEKNKTSATAERKNAH